MDVENLKGGGTSTLLEPKGSLGSLSAINGPNCLEIYTSINVCTYVSNVGNLWVAFWVLHVELKNREIVTSAHPLKLPLKGTSSLSSS